MAVYKTNANKELVKTAGNASSGLPVGTIFPSAIPLTDARVHLLDGSTISQTGVYSDFANLIKTLVSNGYNISCSETEFNNDVASTGNCGKFVIDNNAGTIRLPKITKFIQGLDNISNIGKSLADDFKSHTHTAGYTDNNWKISSNSGAAQQVLLNFNPLLETTTALPTTTSGGEETRPKATQFPYYIVLASGYKSTGAVNTDNIMSDLNNKQDKIKELWINSDPTSNIGGINITLASADYDYLIVIHSMGTLFVSKGDSGFMSFVDIGYWNAANDTMLVAQRGLTYINDTTYTIENCNTRYWNNGQKGGNYVGNSFLKPFKILGVKL